MTLLPTFFLNIARSNHYRENHIETSIIIRRPYAHLEEELRTVFEEHEDVHLILDRRQGERRRRTQSVEVERRLADRRRPKYELLEVAISTRT